MKKTFKNIKKYELKLLSQKLNIKTEKKLSKKNYPSKNSISQLKR